jgi:hypothetical protein
MSGDGANSDETTPTVTPHVRESFESGVDPLIASPKLSTGLTGQIDRPGDRSPPWLFPSMFLGFAVFIVGLVVVGQNRRSSDDVSAIVDAPVVPEQSGDGQSLIPSADAPTQGVPAATGQDVDEAPSDAGSIVIGDATFVVAAQCELHAPFAPLNVGYQISSYLFVDGDRVPRVIDRVLDQGSESATYRTGEFEFLAIEAVGDSGAFVASFRDTSTAEELDIGVNPEPDRAPECSDLLVTNEPGQFSEPHSRIIMDVCIDRTPEGVVVAGSTSQGSRFDVRQVSADAVDVAFRSGMLGATTLRTGSPGSIFLDADVVSVSAVVSDGVETLDLTIDIGTDHPAGQARRCTDGDRL